jgi:hypothetical protein
MTAMQLSLIPETRTPETQSQVQCRMALTRYGVSKVAGEGFRGWDLAEVRERGVVNVVSRRGGGL